MRAVLVSLVLLLAAPALRADCLAIDGGRGGLLALKSDAFSVDDDARRQQLALQLVDCLGSADPELRDGVAFEALSTWMRADQLEVSTLQALRRQLLERLQAPDDALGVRRPFVVLVLSEVARVDRLAARFSVEELGDLVDACVAFLDRIDDYRGFENGVGWRHQVAHGADWVLQLVLNPRVDEAAAARLLDALGRQIAPPDVAYRHGEPERIARAVFFAHQRDVLDSVYWDRSFGRLADPTPFPSWRAAGLDESGLARRHDVLAFLHALHFAATVREGQEDGDLRRRVVQVIEAVSG